MNAQEICSPESFFVKLTRIRDAVLPRQRYGYPLYGSEELTFLRAAAQFNSQLMDELRQHIKPGITTGQLNDIAHQYTLDHGHTPACLGYKGFPKSICTSINDVVCHGIPDETELAEGDMLYLPAFWYHQVDSFASPDGLNVAVNYWFQGHSLATRLYRTLRENVFINCSEPVKPGQLHPCRD